MEFLKYPHLEKYGHPEVDGIDIGDCFIFPKIDGTNASLWWDPRGFPAAGSRKRRLEDGADNHGFREWALRSEEARPHRLFLQDHPHLRLYGEWLVPHTFKDYREDAWRRFYVFDVYDHQEERFLSYEEYLQLLRSDMLAIPPLCTVTNPTQDQLLKALDANHFLCQDGKGPGEGIVLKRYDYTNRYGRATWAKLVRAEFKDAHLVNQTPALGEVRQVEVEIARAAVTQALVDKERAKIAYDLLGNAKADDFPSSSDFEAWKEQWLRTQRSALIPRLLETVFHSVVTEELWPHVKKGAIVDFKKLRQCCIARTKALAADLF